MGYAGEDQTRTHLHSIRFAVDTRASADLQNAFIELAHHIRSSALGTKLALLTERTLMTEKQKIPNYTTL